MAKPLNCSKCGRFVGKDGDPDIWHDPSGTTEIGYPLCGECLRKRQAAIEEKAKRRGGGE